MCGVCVGSPAHPLRSLSGKAGEQSSTEQRKERCQVGSLAGAAHLLKGNAGVLRRAQRGGKPLVEQKGKGSFDCGFSV